MLEQRMPYKLLAAEDWTRTLTVQRKSTLPAATDMAEQLKDARIETRESIVGTAQARALTGGGRRGCFSSSSTGAG